MMKLFIKFILLITFIFPGTGKAQSINQPDSLLNKLIGIWTLKGTIENRPTTHDIVVKRVLNGQYIQLTEVSKEKDKADQPLYTAMVYLTWEKNKKEYDCLWLDNTSNEGLSNGIIGHAKKEDDKMEFLFRYNDSTQFHTTFLYDRNKDTWEWLMNEDNNGKLQLFARLKMTKNHE